MVTENRDEIVTLLEELVRWARFQGIQQAKQVLQRLLEDPEKGDTPKSIYHLSDARSSEEIAKVVGVSSQTVRNYWRSWFTSGVVVPSRSYKGRFEKVFNLEDLGIPLPKLTAAKIPASQEVAEESQGG
jgi:predicted ArsR family transcriptional regulator